MLSKDEWAHPPPNGYITVVTGAVSSGETWVPSGTVGPWEEFTSLSEPQPSHLRNDLPDHLLYWLLESNLIADEGRKDKFQ